MASRLASVYPGRFGGSKAPPILTARTVGVPAILIVVGVGFVLAGEHRSALTFVAAASVCAMQILAPWVRQQSRYAEGVVADVLYAAPFVLFFTPSVVWAALYPPSFSAHVPGALLAVGAALVVQALNLRGWKVLFTPDVLRLLPPLRAVTVAMDSYQLLASAVFQELFYRGVLFVLLLPAWGGWAILISSALFTLEHYANRWGAAAHGKGYYARITLLSVLLGALAYETGSVVTAIAGHVAFNAVPIVQLLGRAAVRRVT